MQLVNLKAKQKDYFERKKSLESRKNYGWLPNLGIKQECNNLCNGQ